MAKKYVQSGTLTLSGSGVIVGATSIVLNSLTDIYGNILTMTDFGDTGYITLEPDTNNEEAATFTGVVANANGTFTLTGVKTALAKSPYTETSGLIRQHAGGTNVVVTDNVAFWNTFGNKSNDEVITGRWGSATVPSANNDYANKAYVDGVAIAGGANASSIVKGISKLSLDPVVPTNPIAVGDNDTRIPTQGENDALVGTVGTPSSTNKYVTNDDTTGTGLITRMSAINNFIHFGGTGVDGALAISSGTTTIDLTGLRIKVLNYTSVSITGTGKLAFSNPHTNGTIIIIKSQGNVTLTSSTAPMIDCSGLGANGGANVTGLTGNVNANGNSGIIGIGSIWNTNFGVGGANGGTSAGGAASSTLKTYEEIIEVLKYQDIFVGAGGGSGGYSQTAGSTGASASGGKGGGALIIECAGAWNFTTASGISVAGVNGGNATIGNGSNFQAGGGGGGGGGYLRVLYNTLTANSGTVTISGGIGGNTVTSSGSIFGAGGGASGKTAGATATSASNGVKSGGNGGDGFSTIQLNEF